MRKTFKFKRWMAFLLAFILTATTCMSSADAFLWATDTNVEDTAAQPEETKPVEETQVVDLSNPPPSDSNGADDVQAPVEEETPEQVQAPQEESAGEPQDGETADDADETQQTEPGADLPGDDDVMTPAGDDVTEEPKNPETQAPEGEEDSDKISGSSEETADTYSYTIAYFYDDVEDEEARVTKDDGVLGDKILTIEVEEEVTLPDGARYELKEIVNEDGVITEDGDNKVEIYYESVEGDEDEADEEETPDDKMPAQTLTGYVDGVKITVDAAEGILPEGTTVEVASVGVEEVQDAINMALEPENLTAVEINAVDITLKKDGESVRPAGSVSVKLENLFSADGHGTVARVYHVSGSSASVVGSADASATNVEFATDHFSVYAGVKAVSGSVMTLEEPGEIKATYTMRVGDTRKLDATTTWARDHKYVVDAGLDVAKVEQVWLSNEANVTALAVGEAFIKHTWTTGTGKKKEEHTEWFKVIVTDEYTITYDLNGGRGTTPASVQAKTGEPITLPTGEGVSRSGYRLLGWSTQKDANTVNEHGDKITIYSLGGEYVVSGDQTLYAVWAKIEGATAGTITIGLRKDGTIPDEPSIQNAEYVYLVRGESVDDVLKYFSPAHTVSGVDNVKSALLTAFYTKVESANVNRSFWNPDTQYVEWYVIKYQGNDSAWHIDGVVRNRDKVNLDYNGNGNTAGLAPDGKQYTPGTEVTVSDQNTLQKTGYDFAEWNTAVDGSGTSYKPGDKITLQESITLYAQWNPKNSTGYKVEHWQQQLDGTYNKVEDEPKSGRTDSKVTAYPKNYTGYVYNPNHLDSKAEGVILADGSLVLKLYYDRATYTVTYDLNGGSSSEKLVYPDLKYGEDTPTLEADPEKPGHTFLGWNPTIEPTVTGNVTYIAKWNKIPYSITYQWAPSTPLEVKDKFSVPVDSKEYFYGESYTISAESYQPVEIVDEYGNVTDRYTFTGWDTEKGIVTGNILVTGSWNHSGVPVSEWRITYEWSGAVPEGDYIQEMPVDGKSYKNNEPYTVDTKYSNGYTVPTYDEYGNVNGNYTFSGWDKQDGKMTEDLTVSGTWKFVETDVAKHNVSYTWKGLPEEKLYDEAGNETTPVLPDSITGLVKNQEYTVDTTMLGTKVYTHDEFGNKNASYTLGEWQDPNSGKMGDSDVEVSAEWKATLVPVSEWRITYEWSGAVPEGDYIQEMPVDGKSYKNNEPYTVDTKYSNGYTVPTYDEYGNVNGSYTFSGWDKQDGKMTDDLTVSGTWAFAETDVAKHNVSYTWKGLPEETLYDEAGKVITPVLPDSITGLVKNQEYTVDTTMLGTKVYTHDEFGNKNASYTLGEWQDPNSGKMGDSDVEVSAEWKATLVPVSEWRITYEWSGAVPEGEYIQEKPVDGKSYKNNEPYRVDTKYINGYAVTTYDEYGNVNGSYTFSGWNAQDGKMTSDLTVRGRWEFVETDVAKHNVSYTWKGLPEETLYDEAGKVITPVLPDSITGLVKNQEYTVDTTMPGMEVYTYDEFGNKNASYKLDEWQDPNGGKMGDSEVVITGEWILESIPVEKYSVQYTYTGNIPQGAEGLLPQTAEYFLNQPVGVADKVHVSGYIFEGWSVSADSNVSVENGRFKMPGHNVTFIGNWVADFGDISANGIADTYDGIEKFVAVTGTREGDQIEYLIDNESVTNSFINATDGELTVVVKVTRGNQEREIPVSVNISPRPIVLRSADLTDRYNGSEYTNPKIIDEDKVDWVASDKAGISYVFTGKQKLVGSSDNTFTVESSNGIRLENYDIKTEFGKLTITDGNTTDPINANDVVTKTHAAGTYEVGDRIEFTITVTNIYDTVQAITIKELETVTFEGFGEDVHSVVFNDVEAGGTRTIKAYYTVTEADAYSGTYQNKVEVAFSNGKGYENTDTVTLEKLYRLSVYHLYRNGATAADTMVRYLKAEEGYTHRPPRIAGYKRSTAFITGTMPEKDLDLIVYYTAVETTTDPTPTPTPDPDPTPTPTPDPDPTPTPPTPDPTPTPTPIVEETVPGVPPVPPTPAAVPAGAAPAVVPAGAVPVEAADPGLVAIDDEEVPLAGTLIGEDEDGNITLTPITEEEIPLANRDLDDHKCCALSFLLMLATLIIYTCYTYSMKKRQEKLAELKDQLAEETLKRRLGITNDRKSRM